VHYNGTQNNRGKMEWRRGEIEGPGQQPLPANCPAPPASDVGSHRSPLAPAIVLGAPTAALAKDNRNRRDHRRPKVPILY
jgi:hypothetical protein